MFRRRTTQKGVVGLQLGEKGLVIAKVEPKGDRFELQALRQLDIHKAITKPREVHAVLQEMGLSGLPCVIVLKERQYHLMLIERPEVPDEEISEALRWRIKDMISFSPENAVIDYLDLPEDAYRGRARMLYAVAADKVLIDQLASWCGELDLRLGAVDIPELAVGNLVAAKADGESGTAVLLLGAEGSVINLYSNGSLYFSRAISLGLEQSERAISSAILEIQRSLDYYESQLGKPPCIHLCVVPGLPEDEPLIQELRYNLALDVISMPASELIELGEHSLEQAEALVAVAAACRPLSEVVKG